MMEGEGSGQRILVVRAGALGDTLMATPVIRALHERYLQSPIDLLCSASALPLVESNPSLSRILPLRRRNLPWALSMEKHALAWDIRSAHYQFAVLLETADQFRDLLFHAGVREVRSYRDIVFNPGDHSIVSNLRVAGFENSGVLDMDLVVGQKDEAAAENLLAGEGSRKDGAEGALIGIHAGFGPLSKKSQDQEHLLRGWATKKFSQLGTLLAGRGTRLVLTGAPEDREEATRIAAGLPSGTFLQLAGKTSVGELAAVIRRTDVFISVDSGPAHMAAALGVPLVVLWGPGILEQTRPVSSRSPVRIVRHAVPCAPCYGTPLMKTCRRNVCMEGISPEEVFREATELLGANP